MKILEDRILKEGIIINNDILKVDSFVNHQIDTKLVEQTSEDIASQFEKADRILTIETSGIPVALGVAQKMGYIPLVFAKKSKSATLNPENCYQAEIKSFTRNVVSTCSVDRRYLHKGEKVLIVDDFLAEGNASLGLCKILKEAGCQIVGVAVLIEKRFQGGRTRLEEQGIKVYACASIDKFENNKPIFHE